jgi:oligopeptide/dipeptide ABC transporter ATP-binding protein
VPGRSFGAVRLVALLDLRHVQVEYRRPGREPVLAVAGASLKVEVGEIMGLVGETGCGKSTLAKAAVGLIPVRSGSIWFEGRQLTALTRRGRSREATRLQLVFQNPFSSLNPRRKIGPQVADPIDILNLLPRKQRRGRVRELLEEVGIPARAADQYPHQFSGGQRQRIAIARALAAAPTAIVMDEPLSALDASAQAQIANLLLKLAHQMNVGILLISHDLAIVRQIADSVSVMYLGLITEMGAARDIWTTPQHPYTQALVNSIPRVDGAGSLPDALSGEVPDPAKPPSGCRFHPRCRFAFDRCTTEVPPLVQVGTDRKAACWLVPPTRDPLTTDR